MNAISAAAAGLTSGIAQFDSASVNVINAVSGQSNASPAGAVVDQVSAQQQITASAAVFTASDRMLKQLLDIIV
jgi:flagellar hook protein FlgE